MSPFMILFIVVDAVLVVSVLVFVLRRQRASSGWPDAHTLDARTADVNAGLLRLVRLRGLAAFADDQHDRIGEYLRCNWSGLPDQLPAVLTTLLTELERDAEARGLPADREALKALLATSLRAHHIGNRGRLREALNKAA